MPREEGVRDEAGCFEVGHGEEGGWEGCLGGKRRRWERFSERRLRLHFEAEREERTIWLFPI